VRLRSVIVESRSEKKALAMGWVESKPVDAGLLQMI
jgi:hypothetical protein